MKKRLSYLLTFLLVFSAIGIMAEDTAEFIPQPTMYTLPLISINMPQLYPAEQFSVQVADGVLQIATTDSKQNYKKGEIFLVSGEEKIDLKYANKAKAYTLDLAKANIEESALKDWRILVDTKIKKDKAFPKEVNTITMQHFFELDNGTCKETRYTITTKTKEASHRYMLKRVQDDVDYHEYFIDDTSVALFDRDGITVKDMSEAASVEPSPDGVARTMYGLELYYLKEDVLSIDPATKLIPSFEGDTLIVKTESGKQDYKKEELYVKSPDMKRSEFLKWNAKQKAYVLDFSALELAEEHKAIIDWRLFTYKTLNKGLGPREWVLQFDMQSGALLEVGYYFSFFQNYYLRHVLGENEFFDFSVNGQKSARYNKDGIRIYGEKPVIPEKLENLQDYPDEALAKEIPLKMHFPITKAPMRIELDNGYSSVYLRYRLENNIQNIVRFYYSAENNGWLSGEIPKETYPTLHRNILNTPGLQLVLYATHITDPDNSIGYTAVLSDHAAFMDFMAKGFDNSAEFTFDGSLTPYIYWKSKDQNPVYSIEKKEGHSIVKFYDSFGIFAEEEIY